MQQKRESDTGRHESEQNKRHTYIRKLVSRDRQKKTPDTRKLRKDSLVQKNDATVGVHRRRKTSREESAP